MELEELGRLIAGGASRFGEDPFREIQAATDAHRSSHGCWAYPYDEGSRLGTIAAAIDARRVLELGTALGYTAPNPWPVDWDTRPFGSPMVHPRPPSTRLNAIPIMFAWRVRILRLRQCRNGSSFTRATSRQYCLALARAMIWCSSTATRRPCRSWPRLSVC